MFVIVSGSLGSMFGAFCLLGFILWTLKQFGKPYSPSDKQMIWVILFYLICLYPCFKIFEYDKQHSGWNSHPMDVAENMRFLVIGIILFSWTIPFIGFSLYNKKKLNY